MTKSHDRSLATRSSELKPMTTGDSSQERPKIERTHICLLLDRSGSMASIKNQTINGFNKFIKAQKALPTPASFTLVQFDSLDPFEVVHRFVDIQQVDTLSRDTFIPRAGTPLYDAVGSCIHELKAGLDGLPETLRPTQVVVVIVTDGEENSSREFIGEQVGKMIDDAKLAGWQFVFLSADESAIKNSGALKIQTSHSAYFQKNEQGSGEMWDRLSHRFMKYRMRDVNCMRMDEPEQDKASA